MRTLRELLKLHFKKLEKKLDGDDDVSNISMEFPRLIIDACSKVLRLWIENPHMQSIMKPEELQPIYATSNQLLSSFGETSENCTFRNSSSVTNNTNFSFTCDICDEEIYIKNNDLDYSFDIHAQTQVHREIEEKLNNIGKKPETKNATYNALPTKTLSAELFSIITEPNIVIKDDITQKVGKKRNNKKPVIQVEKNINKIENQSDASDCAEHTVDSMNEKLPLSSLPNEIRSVFSTKKNHSKKCWCLVCDCWVPSDHENLMKHVGGKKHILKKKQQNTTKILTNTSAPSEVLKCFEEFDFVGKTRWCAVCLCPVLASDDEKNLTVHVRGFRHQLNWKKHRLDLKKNPTSD